MPYCVSKIHCQMTVAVSAGIDHASISPIIVSSRIFLPEPFRAADATAIPNTIVKATLTAQNTTVRRSTVQNSGSYEDRRGSSSRPTHSAGAPNCCFRPKFCSASVTSRTSGNPSISARAAIAGASRR